MEDFILRMSIGLPGFLLAVVAHEAAHAYMAHRFGDDTAKNQGRISLNPIVHMDIMGSVLFPLIGAAIGGIMFGWAKPVPVNSRNFKNYRKAIFWVSFAGPGMNIILGTISAFLLSLTIVTFEPGFYLYKPFIEIFKQSVYINFILAGFNLIPFPPLDGSKMVSTFLNHNTLIKYEGLSRYTFIFFIILLFTRVINYLLLPAIFAAEWLIRFFYGVMV